MDLVAASLEAPLLDKPGGIFMRRGEQMSDEDRACCKPWRASSWSTTAARCAEQIERRGPAGAIDPALKPTRRPRRDADAGGAAAARLAFFNGLGGFSRDGREYVIILAPARPRRRRGST